MREHAVQLGYDFGGYDVVPGLKAVHMPHEGEGEVASLAHKHPLQEWKVLELKLLL